MSLISRLDASILKAIAPRVPGYKGTRQAEIIAAVGPHLGPVLEAGDIATPLRIAHFLAQIAHESDGMCTTEEYATGAAYEGRRDLGNTQPGDGRRYKGRGLLQLTGRANYTTYSQILSVDLLGDPERAAEPVLSLRVAAAFWRREDVSPAADRDDLVTVTRIINGGRNGLADRAAYLGKAKAAIAALQAADMQAFDAARPVLRRGSDCEAVDLLQRDLRQLGYPLAVDGAFGPATETAVRLFQRHAGLVADGIVGPKTWAAILHAQR